MSLIQISKYLNLLTMRDMENAGDASSQLALRLKESIHELETVQEMQGILFFF